MTKDEQIARLKADNRRLRRALKEVEHTHPVTDGVRSERKSCNLCCLFAPHHASHCTVGNALAPRRKKAEKKACR